jgi:serine-type D-Ala-D-Ala carboxypeptidase (penicillin-binding protein 5/6)
VLRRLAVLATLATLVVAWPAVAAAPTVEADAYIVLDPATGEVLERRAPDRELPMASTTKIMTALVALESADLDDVMTVPPDAAVGGSTGGLVAGERLSVRDLLTALLVASGNDAAVTLAEGVAGSQAAFVARMNRRARELGLTETRFANPHGLDAAGHHSSVRDLVTLAREAMRNPVFRRTVSQRRATIPGPGGVGERELVSENLLLDVDPDVDGVKTGMTDGAGYALVAHARRRPDSPELYLALIGAPSEAARVRDGLELLGAARARYAPAMLIAEGAVFGSVPVDDRPGTSVPYRAAAPLVAPLRLGEPVTETIAAPTEIAAPVEEGQVIGSVTVRQGDRVLGRRALVAAESAGEPSVWDRVRAGLEELVP